MPENAVKIDYNEAQPGDLIKMHGLKHGLHIAIITKTQHDEKKKLKKIWYTESSPYYAEANGVRIGTIDISSNSKKLEQQDWDSENRNGPKFTLQNYLKDIEENGIFRPNFMKKLA